MSILVFGARGVEVSRLQRLLTDYFARKSGAITPQEIGSVAVGYPKIIDVEREGFKLRDDGDFGERTDAAVRLLQTHEHIRVDGAVGPMTRGVLEQRPIAPLQPEDPKANGMLINGRIVPVPGHRCINPSDAAWAHLSPGDCMPRRKRKDGSHVYPQMWIWHKTIADDPEILTAGAGPAGGARRTADYWRGDPHYGGAHIVVGEDGEIAVLADLVLIEAFHATVSNAFSIGHETRERIVKINGKTFNEFFQASAEATVDATWVGCEDIGIQLQSHSGPYMNRPLRRMERDGGTDMVGVFGHRDNTHQRGKWDPGEILWKMAKDRGMEFFDFEAGEDLRVWRERQTWLVRQGHKIEITGVPRLDTVEALKREGYRGGIWALGKN